MQHYVYKITNMRTGSYYIGSRSHISPITDSYMGSSKLLNMLYLQEGMSIFDKKILAYFNTRKEANNFEDKLVTEALNIEPKKCYNKRRPGTANCEKQHNIRADLYNDYFNNIRNEYLDGIPVRVLARKYRADSITIKNIISDIFEKRMHAAWKYKEEICNSYKKNISMVTLSKKYSADIGTIRSILMRNNIQIRRGKEAVKNIDKKKELKTIDENYMISLYVKNMTIRDISKKMGVHQELIVKRLKKHGLKPKKGAILKVKKHIAWHHVDEIKELYNMKYSKKYICTKFNIKDQKTLNKILSEAEVA